MHQVRLSLEVMRADVEEFGGKAYRMGKGSKDDAVVALLKDQLDEFKQVRCICCAVLFMLPLYMLPLYMMSVYTSEHNAL